MKSRSDSSSSGGGGGGGKIGSSSSGSPERDAARKFQRKRGTRTREFRRLARLSTDGGRLFQPRAAKVFN
jgi:hypothetical protein